MNHAEPIRNAIFCDIFVLMKRTRKAADTLSRLHPLYLLGGFGTLILIGLIILLGTPKYTHLIATTVNTGTKMPAFCYDKQKIGTANVTYFCTKPDKNSFFIGTVSAVLEDQNIEDSRPQPGSTYVGDYEAQCVGYCTCLASTSPIQPSSCPADELHSFDPGNVAPLTCQYAYQGKMDMSIDQESIVIRYNKTTSKPQPKYSYTYTNTDGKTVTVQVANQNDFFTKNTQTKIIAAAQEQCNYQARKAANGTGTSKSCSNLCPSYIKNDAAELRQTGICTTYQQVPKNPLPEGCTTPSPTPSAKPTTSPRPSNTPLFR